MRKVHSVHTFWQQTLPIPHCIVLSHWQLHTQMCLGWNESPLRLVQQSSPPAFFSIFFYLQSAPLSHTMDLSSLFLSSISFSCYHPCLSPSSKSSSPPWAESLSPSFSACFLFISFSLLALLPSLSLGPSQEVFVIIEHMELLWMTPWNDAREKTTGGKLDSDTNKPGFNKVQMHRLDATNAAVPFAKLPLCY